MKYMSKFERKPKGKHNQADFNNSCNFHCPPPFSATKEHFLFSEMGSCILIHNSYSAQSWHCSFHVGSAKNSLHPHEKNHPNTTQFFCSKDSKQSKCLTHSTLGKKLTIQCKKNKPEMPSSPSVTKTQDPLMGSSADMDCIGSGLDVESVIPTIDDNSEEGEKLLSSSSSFEISNKQEFGGMVNVVLDTLLLISPFFFWGTAMVAMKEVLPKTGPLFVAAVRLIPSGFLLIGFAQYSGKKQPSGFMSWLSLALFGLVDAACFQGFLAEGLKRTSAGLGSVIIDSQPLTVAVLAAILFGESIGTVGAAGLLLGVIGLLLLEVPALNGTDISETVVSQSAVFQQNFTSFLGSGEWWMLLAAQSMAIGTVMVRWVCKYSDPVMATGWHMIIGGLPLLALSVIQHDPAFTGSIQELDLGDWLALTYTSIFGSAISYGVYFYNATRGSLTKLSSLTFLTPMFASIFGYFFLEETFSPIQLLGALITVVAIYMVNSRDKVQSESD